MEKEIQPFVELLDRENQDNLLMEYKYHKSLCMLIRGMTHDYNNIFNGLSGQLKLIFQGVSMGDINERRTSLVNELLARGVNKTEILYEFSRYTSSEKEDHSISRILELAVALLNTLSRSHHFVIEKHEKFSRLQCSVKDIVMVLFYFGENAIEAMPEGGTISLGGKQHPSDNGDEIVLSVRNRGRGVSPSVRESLFKPFVTTNRSSQGVLGLGLYAAQNIASQHGGTLFFTDNQDEGTGFFARFPISPLKEETNRSFETELAYTAPSRKIVSKKKKEVFYVIEDDEAMRDLVVRILQRSGHVVFAAETCAEAVEEYAFIHETVTVLLIDLGLTDSDGYECLKKMMAISTKAKVVFMSGENVKKENLIKYNALFLRKPFSAKEIEDIVNQHE